MMAWSGGKPAAEVDFSDREQVQEWFRLRPREVIIALTMRSALRVLPLIGAAHNVRDFALHVALPALRVCFVTWATAEYPSEGDRLRNPSAVSAAIAGAKAVDAPVYTAVYAAIYAAVYADATATAAGANALYGAYALAFAANAVAAHTANLAAANTYAPVAGRADVIAIEQGRAVTEILTAPLWPGGMPEWIAEAWDRLRTWMLEGDADSWHPWVQWYERVRDGHPSFGEAFDLAVASLTDEQWNEQPRPAAVNRRIAALLAEHTPPEPIPPQGPGPHFTLGPDLRIALALPAELDADGNNLARIRQLLPVVRQTAADLAGHLNPNTQPEISRNLSAYRTAIADEPETIAWGIVFGLGLRLDNAAAAASRQIEDRLQPPLEDAAQEALDTVLTLHGPLILATKEGRELADEADRYHQTREEQAALHDDARKVATALANSPDIIEPEAAKVADDAAEAMGEGRHPERGTIYGLATLKHAATVFIPAAALASFVPMGAAAVGLMGAAAGGGIAWVGYETFKKSRMYEASTKALGPVWDDLLGRGEAQAVRLLIRLTPFRNFVGANEDPLRRIAEKTTQLRWALRYIDFILRTNDKQ
jgi:hypothetical protein